MGKLEHGPLTETTFLILLAMWQPNHGYGVMQFVEERTKGRVVFGPGTLYGAINNLDRKGWIEPIDTDPVDRKQDYIITAAGRKRVFAELARLKEICDLGVQIVEAKDHD